MKEETLENDKLIYDKISLPKHNYITVNLLIKRKFIKEDDVETFMYDDLFEKLLQHYDFKLVLITASYVISRVKSYKNCDEDGEPIRSLYAYFRSSIIWNLKKITGEVDLGWLDSEEDFDWLNDDYG